MLCLFVASVASLVSYRRRGCRARELELACSEISCGFSRVIIPLAALLFIRGGTQWWQAKTCFIALLPTAIRAESERNI